MDRRSGSVVSTSRPEPGVIGPPSGGTPPGGPKPLGGGPAAGYRHPWRRATESAEAPVPRHLCESIAQRRRPIAGIARPRGAQSRSVSGVCLTLTPRS